MRFALFIQQSLILIADMPRLTRRVQQAWRMTEVLGRWYYSSLLLVGGPSELLRVVRLYFIIFPVDVDGPRVERFLKLARTFVHDNMT